ncbi:hypothetical protein B0H13DRAFT_2664325 [Mycena leptocephala]|nr:hypothetical protein B0H13DRAFT_2664325 [Mycena leptocephala]
MERKADKASWCPSSSPAPSTFHPPALLPHPRPPPSVPVRGRPPNAAHTHPVRMLVLPKSSPEDADMFRMLERVDVTYLSRPSSGNSESARLCMPTIGKGAVTDLNHPARCAGDAVSNKTTLMSPISGYPALPTALSPRSHAYTVAANPALRRIFLGDDLVSGYICFTSGSSTPRVGLASHVDKHAPAACPKHRSPPLPLFLLPWTGSHFSSPLRTCTPQSNHIPLSACLTSALSAAPAFRTPHALSCAAGARICSEPRTRVQGRALPHTATTLMVPALVLLFDPARLLFHPRPPSRRAPRAQAYLSIPPPSFSSRARPNPTAILCTAAPARELPTRHRYRYTVGTTPRVQDQRLRARAAPAPVSLHLSESPVTYSISSPMRLASHRRTGCMAPTDIPALRSLRPSLPSL